jgi:hypothetical protein
MVSTAETSKGFTILELNSQASTVNDETKPREEQVLIALFLENDVKKKRDHLSDCLYGLAVIDITRALSPKTNRATQRPIKICLTICGASCYQPIL